jgi:N6-adenosine-specific RNA methylase IME4
VQLNQIEGAIQWWIGDWLNFGECKYGELYAQAIEAGANTGTWMNYKYVANRVKTSLRNEVLGYHHHVSVAPLEPEDQKYWLEKAEKEGLSVTALRQAIKHEKLLTNADKIPEGKYMVIYADPPWEYNNSGFTESAEDQYPTMDLQSICDLEVGNLCTDQTVLFLWATNPLLPEALKVIDAWGFTYKTNMAWVKDRGRGKGWYLKSEHELLIIATRENSPHPLQRPDSCFEADRGPVHSRKPEIAYQIIEDMYPGKKIELFARNNRPGWESWGNQL